MEVNVRSLRSKSSVFNITAHMHDFMQWQVYNRAVD